jgi:hypothetical protein
MSKDERHKTKDERDWVIVAMRVMRYAFPLVVGSYGVLDE